MFDRMIISIRSFLDVVYPFNTLSTHIILRT